MSNASNVTPISLCQGRRDTPESQTFSAHVVRVNHSESVGVKRLCLMAGPCSVESEEQLLNAAQFVQRCGGGVLRAGVYKPRTSPYSFQGLGKEGLRILKAVKESTGLSIVSEVLDVRVLEQALEVVDVVQVGTRNMYNYPLLKELGMIKRPVLLKRGMMATVEEFLGAAEYILSHGNDDVILCERGIRSFDSSTRFTLDLNIIPVLKERTRLPVVVDPSHGTGVAKYVEPMSLAAIAAGADGLLIEVHHDPKSALSDGKQSLDFEHFESLCNKVRSVANAVGRTF